MKRLLFVSVFAAGLSIAFAADQTVTGVITDSLCKSNHALMQKGANKMSDHDCTVACVKMLGQNMLWRAATRSVKSRTRPLRAWRRTRAAPSKATGQVTADGKSITLTKLSSDGGK
jgi:hypothetical protein